MKKILPLLLLIIYTANAGLKFDYIDLVFHQYRGIVSNDKYVFFYGTNNYINRSNHDNSEWKSITITENEFSIKEMRSETGGFYGVYESGLFRLDDEGNIIYKKQLDNPPDEEFVDIVKFNDEYIVVSENSIFVYDNDFNLLNTKDYDSGIVISEIETFGDNLLAGTKNGLLFKYKNSIDNGPEIIDFSEKSYCDSTGKVQSFEKSENYFYLKIAGDLYKSSDLISFTKVDIIGNSYNVNEDEIYSLQLKQSGFGEINDQLYFYKNNAPDYEQISNPDLKRYCEILIPIGFDFINDKEIYAYGYDNLILKSSDGGINWDFISYFKPGFNRQWISKETGFQKSDDGVVYKTTNGGITWKTEIKMDEKLSNWPTSSTFYFNEDGRGIIVGSGTPAGLPNVIYTNDGGETFQTKYIEGIGHYIFDKYAPIIRDNDEYKIYFPGRYQSWYYTLLFTLDLDMNFISKEIIDSVNIYKIEEYGSGYLALAKDRRPIPGRASDHNPYQLLYSDEPGGNWDTLMTLDMMDTLLHNMSIIDDIIYMRGFVWVDDKDSNCRHILYKVNISEKTKQLIRIKFNENYDGIFKFDNKLIAGAINGLVYCNNIDDNPYEWEFASVPGYFVWNFENQFNDLIYAYCSGQNLLKFTFHKDTPVEEPRAEGIKMYNYPPYPQPANNHVSTEIYWDSRYDIQNAAITVHDYTGKLVSKPGDISINKMNVYRGEISWDCSSVSSGVYFINIRLGGTTRTVPVVVGR